MKIARSFTFSCLALVVLIALSGYAFSTTVAVGTCTKFVHFATIQLAANSVPAGSTIDICPGNYPEQVVIAKNLTLTGVASASGSQAVVILPPVGGVVQNATGLDTPWPAAAQILVQNNAVVKINNLTVDGTGNNAASSDLNLIGILFQNASGTLNHVVVRNQLPAGVPAGDSGYGHGIYVQSSSGSSTVTVQNSSVHDYNKNGITGNDPGTTLIVTGSFVQGNGALGYGYDAQNGIQVGWGAAGKISTTKVIDNSYVGPDWCASSILFYNAAEVTTNAITNNIIGNSNCPISLNDYPGPGADDNVTVTGNTIFGSSVYDAIDACSNNNTITGNTIVNSTNSGLHLDGGCGATGTGNTVNKNIFVESACIGILYDSDSAPDVGTDTYFAVPFPLADATIAASCVLPGYGSMRHNKPMPSPKR